MFSGFVLSGIVCGGVVLLGALPLKPCQGYALNPSFQLREMQLKNDLEILEQVHFSIFWSNPPAAPGGFL